MLDRLLALLLTLTLAAPALVRPPCCCAVAAANGTECVVAQTIAEEGRAKPACCQTGAVCDEASLRGAGRDSQRAASQRAASQLAPPRCCQVADIETINDGPGVSLTPLRCGCDGCLSARPENPLAGSPTAPNPPSVDELPPAVGAAPLDPPCALLPLKVAATVGDGLFNRPPPDRQALLCVWTI